MGREIQFSLVYRDMWQSAGKYMPGKDQLEQIAPVIIDMDCFSRVETNGGGFEQIQLLFGENPNKAVRAWCKPFNDAGIKTHMLERGLNGIRMNPVPADVRKLMFKVKKRQGVDIARSFDGLNDVRNIIDSINFAKQGGMIAQGTLSLTHSKIHTVDYYVKMASELIDAGSEEICLKDMAGIGRPVSLGKIVEGIKAAYPDILIQYHGQTAPGFTTASILEVARAGAEIIDVGMEPLSWGTGHADLLTVQAMLEDAGFTVPKVNMKAYMEARRLTQGFIDDFLGYFINPRNRYLNSLLIGSGLPGGMMGSLMSDLENNLNSLNKWLRKNDKQETNLDELLLKLFEEVEYIWPKMGYPPLVTPYSQYVKNTALINVMQMAKGKERWSIIDDNTWDMLLGKQGQLPGPLDPELIEKAKMEGREFYTGNPQDLYPDELDMFKKEMDEKGWDYGEDDEELFELAMHPVQYRNMRSGKAKSDFEKELAEKKAKNSKSESVETATSAITHFSPKTLQIDVNGEKFLVNVSYEDSNLKPSSTSEKEIKQPVGNTKAGGKEIQAPLEGSFFLTKNNDEAPVKVGDNVTEGQVIGYIESMKVYNAISSNQSGVVTEVCLSDGAAVEEDDVLIRLK
ncbi:MAG TPA: oxaloacetate decarboxylase [Cytophagales bacterium]|jgi:pyruvate carboxylase subunit B|nr:oxaloacetate decarboxylase [Cytophagales bacterium]